LEEIFANEFDEDIVYGDIYLKSYEEIEIEQLVKNKVLRTGKQNIHNPVNWNLRAVIKHQASFIKRDLLNNLEKYKTIYKHASDTEFFVNAIFNHNASAKHVKVVFAVFVLDGISSSGGKNTASDLINKTEYGKITVNTFPYSYRKIIAFAYFYKLFQNCTLPLLWIVYFFERTCRFGVKKTMAYYPNKIIHKRGKR
jgi:hypothetical protein